MRAWSLRTEAAVSPSTADAGNGKAKTRNESRIRAALSEHAPMKFETFMELRLSHRQEIFGRYKSASINAILQGLLLRRRIA
jgi:hypothetical protein